jgi:ketosteroid isomerase-like protein
VADPRIAWFLDEIERWNSGDREVESDRVHPDFELESQMLGGVVRGPEGLRAWYAEIDQQFEAWQIQIAEILDLGEDRFLLTGTIRMRGKESGLEMEQEVGWLLEFEHGQLRRMKPYTDVALGRAEAGLEHPDGA